MNNILLYLLVTLAVILFAIIVISTINAVRKSVKNKYEYRIKKVTVGTKDKYYIQKHFLFFWYTCEALLCESGYKEFFDTLEENDIFDRCHRHDGLCRHARDIALSRAL